MKFVNLKALIGVVLICLVFIISQTAQVSAFSVKELLGLEKPEEPVQAKEKAQAKNKQKKDASKQKDSNWAQTDQESAKSNPQINLNYVSLLVANMNQQERDKVLADSELFKQVIENEANNRSTISAAIANKLEQDRNVEFLMRRGAENILREAYLSRLIASKLPKDFPSKEQVNEYYETNKAQFVVPERIHVWQIFFGKPKDADEKQVSTLKKKANQLVSDIKKGKADFSNIALAESEHEQSKALGGYMGLLKTDELLPEIKDPILKLKEGEISKPVVSETGVHIIKRGKLLKSETLTIEQVEPQIRQLLVKQVQTQLRNTIYVQARNEYPQALTDKKLEEWRLRLRTNTTQ